MKKSARIGSVLLGLLMAFSIVGCDGDTSENNSVGGTSTSEGTSENGGNSGNSGTEIPDPTKYDPETRPIVFSTAALDGNFNPFFATSGTDTTIAGITQIGMLTTDAQGNPVCGEDQPTVVLDYKETMKKANGQETTDGTQAATTEYEFIIKNDIKFSDGVKLTIKDVLFNLYVYLDPAYMGSATIYSTDIVGLQQYRTQDPLASDDASDSETQQTFYVEAEKRVQSILDYLDPKTDGELTAQIQADIELTRKLFKKEVTSDWTTNEGTLESYKEEYTFTEDWQVYYFAEGIVSIKYEQNANGAYVPVKDADGKYVTTLDNADNMLAEEIENVKNGLNPDFLPSKYEETQGCTAEQAIQYAVRDFAIDTVYNTYSDESKLSEVLTYWATANNVRDEFANEARSDYYETLKGEDGELRVKTVSGVTTTQTDVDYDGNDLDGTHDVLKIVINGVDPKAIWNFAFSVAPMHYYSSAEEAAKADGVEHFGVKFADKTFFDEVLQASDKNIKPVGAGTYMASDSTGSDDPKPTEFYKSGWVYYKRNPYFETVGDGLCNAKIKYMRYKVVGSDQLLNQLITGEIDFAEPNATQDNISKVGEYSHLGYKDYRTNGYGYIGINPKYVPDIEVRQAIMKAMNTASIIQNYYTESLASVLYRPMSLESWAYPTVDGSEDGEPVGEYDKVAYTVDKYEITDLVDSAGWTLGKSGIYEKNGEKLELTFTIAGETTDHPAYAMFEEAATFLRGCGFDITVTTDPTALKKLATGGMEVWAAAWSSTVDPDMYQVYHKDSTATSVKNWGYSTIFADTTGQFDFEKETINELSELIEAGRETINRKERREIYAQALDLVMELCVELPTYQRRDLVVYNSDIINVNTLNSNPSSMSGVVDRLWEVNYN